LIPGGRTRRASRSNRRASRFARGIEGLKGPASEIAACRPNWVCLDRRRERAHAACPCRRA
jgi:hypothetical protein